MKTIKSNFSNLQITTIYLMTVVILISLGILIFNYQLDVTLSTSIENDLKETSDLQVFNFNTTYKFIDNIPQDVKSDEFISQFIDNIILPSFSGMGYAFVIDQTGHIISSLQNDYILSNSSNLLSSWDEAYFIGENKLDVTRNIANGLSGSVKYSIYGENRYAYYAPLGVNDWYMISVVPDAVISRDTQKISDIIFILEFFITIGILLCFMYVGYIYVKKNIQQNEHKKTIDHLSYFDELTGIYNINKFKSIFKDKHLNSTLPIATLVKFDINNFKMINEMYNFNSGNIILQKVAKVLSQHSWGSDITILSYARIASDEFIVLLNTNHSNQVNEWIKIFERKFHSITMVLVEDHRISFKYGTCLVENSQIEINHHLENLNLAHKSAYYASDQICHYDKELKQSIIKETELENSMENALFNKEYKLYIQPKFNIASETYIGGEALVRWQKSNGNFVYPNDFIPLFEKNGFISKLDFYMLDKVCNYLKDCQNANKKLIPISVNFSRIHLANSNFVNQICEVVDAYNIPRKFIEIEITESAILDNATNVKIIVEQLHKNGFTVSVDDFGSGYSSLSLIKDIHVDFLKIDKSFFDDIINDKKAQIVLKNVINMAKDLDIITVAEGIEKADQIEILKSIGCNIVQGYYYAKPMPASDFTNILDTVNKEN